MNRSVLNLIIVAFLGFYSTLALADNSEQKYYQKHKQNPHNEIEFVGLGNELVFLFSDGVKQIPNQNGAQNHYKGSVFSSHSIIYDGGTLENSDCTTPFKACGVQASGDGKMVPEFPDKVIGTSTFLLHIVTDEMDKPLDALFMNDRDTFLTESEKLSGRIVFEFRGILNFNNSIDHLKLANDTITLHGYILWGNNGEEWNMAITGGTGIYKNIKGEANFKRLTLVNAGGVSSFRIKLPKKV